ncbi:MAG: (2Fe-2S)-binding protein [Solirubrobacteraceae bacterium]|jgi:carbon-monoxide dehydrogenase small subunit
MAVASTSKQLVAFKINGEQCELAVSPNHTLLEVLREDAGLTGTKHGCEQGECGLCTVIIDGLAQFSCLALAVDLVGAEIRTVEGLAAAGELSVLQQAYVETGASQCGYCSPGMLMSAQALLERNPAPTRSEIREALAGNLCRCTGYLAIIDAVALAAARLRSAT